MHTVDGSDLAQMHHVYSFNVGPVPCVRPYIGVMLWMEEMLNRLAVGFSHYL